jgi:hypothetical protein
MKLGAIWGAFEGGVRRSVGCRAAGRPRDTPSTRKRGVSHSYRSSPTSGATSVLAERAHPTPSLSLRHVHARGGRAIREGQPSPLPAAPRATRWPSLGGSTARRAGCRRPSNESARRLLERRAASVLVGCATSPEPCAVPAKKCLWLDDAQHVPPGRRDGSEHDQGDPVEPRHARPGDRALQHDELVSLAPLRLAPLREGRGMSAFPATTGKSYELRRP